MPERTQPDALQSWAHTCDALAATTKKLEKRALLAAYLVTLPVPDAALAALYTAGQPFPEIDRRQLSVGGSLLGKAVAARTGASAEALTLAFRRHGDIGSAAEELMMADTLPEPATLLLSDLAAMLAEIAAARGPAAKLSLLSALLARAGAGECKYTLKLLAGDMRIGVKAALVEEAVAAAYAQPLAAVRHAGMLLGSLAEVVERAAAGSLEAARMLLFHPIGFMLASPVDSVEEAVARFTQEVALEEAQVSTTVLVTNTETDPETKPSEGGRDLAAEMGKPLASASSDLPAERGLRDAQLEDKYDGMRAQLHAGDPAEPGRVGLFSRNREDLAPSFPELIEAFATLSEPVILDGEILAWQPLASPSAHRGPDDAEGLHPLSSPTSEEASARALPFSSLQQRLGRRTVSPELRRSLPVVFMAFDILYADNQLLLDQPLATRRARLERYLAAHAARTDGSTHIAQGQQQLFATETVTETHFPRLLLAPALRLASAEQLDRAYAEARARGNEGVMLKSSASPYQPGRRGLAWLKLKRELATLDVLVTGAEYGSGRRAGFLSDYTFAIRDDDGTLLNIGKAYSGITDAEMHTLSAHFHAHTLEDHGHYRSVEPDTILEVAFNNITRSTRHASGYALRFPRILRIRTDKPPKEIDTLSRVTTLYHQQPDRPVE
jgi:DNA ligase-1